MAATYPAATQILPGGTLTTVIEDRDLCALDGRELWRVLAARGFDLRRPIERQKCVDRLATRFTQGISPGARDFRDQMLVDRAVAEATPSRTRSSTPRSASM